MYEREAAADGAVMDSQYMYVGKFLRSCVMRVQRTI